MEMKFEGIAKEERKFFKHFMDFAGVTYSFKKSDAVVKLEEPYFTTEETMQRKNDFKRAMQQGIVEFRNYSFNK